jgi:GNAT superfamily N-acetyltransferase
MNTIHYAPAPSERAEDYICLRGQTRENAINPAGLAALGITAESWAADIRAGVLQGVMAECDGQMVGYCFGGLQSGEVVVLALLPAFEGQGIGQALLRQVMALLRERGHQRLFLGCSSDPQVRSYGFYRHLGWRSTGEVDDHGDEVLEWRADG